MGVLKSLVVPTAADYDFAVAPEDQIEFANPVVLANQVVRLANIHGHMTGKIARINAAVAALRGALADAKHALADLEADLLAKYPPPAAERKSNKLLDTYIRRAAFENGFEDRYRALTANVRKLQKELEEQDIHLETARAVQQSIKLQGEHLQTYLSYKKHEADQSRRY
jgi:hypothetical protein